MYEDVLDVARDAGKVLMNYFGKKVDIKNKDPENYSPVSIADLESNELICKGLEKYGYQILSEELDNENLDLSNSTWIIDPLDGTIGYLKGGKDFCVMIGLMIDKEIVFGVVYLPFYDKMYYAQKGKGAWLVQDGNKSRIHVSHKDLLSNSSRVAPHGNITFLDSEIDTKLNCDVKLLGSIGVRMCTVAEGKVDFYVHNYSFPNKWDTAAPTIILEEAGGCVTDFCGEKIDYSESELILKKSFIASNSLLHKQILQEIPENALECINAKR
ncbi:MAG: inositol monophosphatase family protein [Candidatus Woesearchaeota archaeon]